MKLTKNMIDKYFKSNSKEQYEFLLKNHFYIRPEGMTDKSEEDFFNEQPYFINFKNKNWLNTYYNIHPDFIDIIILNFIDVGFDTSTIISKINTDLELSLDVEKTLLKYHGEYNNVFIENDIPTSEFIQNNKVDKEKLNKYLKNHFKIPDCHCITLSFIENFIKLDYNINSIGIFGKVKSSIISMDILKFLHSYKKLPSKLEVDTEELKTYGQKIMMMKELGIIDFIIKKYQIDEFGGVNYNKLSKIISSFTGIKYNTIDKILSGIYKNTEDKNNPISDSNNNKIKAKMIELGLVV